ncbi:hypothetical protein Tco_1250998 [Tanacetum coccineum]
MVVGGWKGGVARERGREGWERGGWGRGGSERGVVGRRLEDGGGAGLGGEGIKKAGEGGREEGGRGRRVGGVEIEGGWKRGRDVGRGGAGREGVGGVERGGAGGEERGEERGGRFCSGGRWWGGGWRGRRGVRWGRREAGRRRLRRKGVGRMCGWGCVEGSEGKGRGGWGS